MNAADPDTAGSAAEHRPVRLSLCIATFNRGKFIAETLNCLASQLQDGVEIVVVDGASPDNTADVVGEYASRFPAIRYFRETENSEVDRDYDKAVGYAAGEHCWLLTDDDTLAPGAVQQVLRSLDDGAIDLLIVDGELRDASMAQRLRRRRLSFSGSRTYGPQDRDAFLRDAGHILSFIAAVVIRRSLWLQRDREPYFGTLFIHVGVILQAPIERVKVLAEPLLIVRLGNAQWRPRSFEIWGFKWPALIWGFDGYASAAKQSVTPREPWRKLQWLMGYRALSDYSMGEYRRFFGERKVGLSRLPLVLAAVFPGRLANLIGVCMLALTERGGRNLTYEIVTSSRFSNRISRWIAHTVLNRAGESP